MSSVLVVEDDTGLREVLHEFLSEEHPCYAASTVEEAMTLLDANRFDVVLTDISMPGKSGLELLGYVKQQWPETAVIMLSGINDQDYAQGLCKMGAFDFLAKPFQLDDVWQSVARAIGQKQQASADEQTARDTADEQEGGETDGDNGAIFSSIQLGGVFSLAELLEIVQRGRMSGYIELHWDNATIKQARQIGKFNNAAGSLDEAVLHCSGWIYLKEGLIIDAAIDEEAGSQYWRDAEQSLTLLVKLATFIGKGVRAWGFSMARMDRPAKLTVWDNSGKLFGIITSDEADEAAASAPSANSPAERMSVEATLETEPERVALAF